jgi:hypothetical protein
MMFKWINNYVNESFDMDTFKSKNSILSGAKSIIEGCDFFDKSEPLISDGRIEINRMPGTLNPFGGLGKIVIVFNEYQNWTTLRCETFPYNNAVPTILNLALGTMILWSMIGLLLSWSIWSLVVILSGWLIAGSSCFLSIWNSKITLRRYATRIVDKLIS